MTSLSIDVVVVSYDRYDLTESCLRHLGAQTREHCVIVVDNGSTEDAPERIAEHWRQHTLLRIERNGPFSVAANIGVAAGTADVIVLLNNDVDCEPTFLERLVAPLEVDPELGSVAGLMVQPGERVIDSIGLRADPTLAGFPRHHWQPTARAADAAPSIVGPAGTGAAYRRRAWDEVDGLDEHIFAYNEDLDLALRLRTAGWGTVAAPDAVGVHLGSATHGHRSAWQRRHGGWARGYMLRRYGVLRGPKALRALLTEAIVCVGDAVISRDLAATTGRIRGWHAGRGLPRRAWPPADAIDDSITLRASLAMRRAVYALPR
jgi:GT2 family glycosyltransferase